MTRPPHTTLRHTESTRHYTKHVNFADPPLMEAPLPPFHPTQIYESEEIVRGRYEAYEMSQENMERGQVEMESDLRQPSGRCDDFGYSTISTPDSEKRHQQQQIQQSVEEISDMEYYTSSETGSQETVKFKPNKEAKPGIQILVQSPAEVEAEKEEEFVENLYAEIDLKIQPAKAIETRVEEPLEPQTLVEETVAEGGTVSPQHAGVLMEMKDFESKLEEIIKSTEEVFIMNSKDHYASVLGDKMYREEKQEKLREDEVFSTEEQKPQEKPIPKPPPQMEPKVTGKPPKPPQCPRQFKPASLKHDIPRFPERFNETTEATFYEEEYSYEPDLKRSSTKVVMRTRSLVNLDEGQGSGGGAPAKRGKITTGPDGTFRFAGRKATSEMNLSDESGSSSADGSPKAVRHFSGEELRRRKEEIFKEKPRPAENKNKYNEEINYNCDETTKQRALRNLKRYLKENNIGLREILVNNNVVIIEPVRSENGSEYNHKNGGEGDTCRITGATTKEPVSNTLPRVSKPYQTTVQRHFFYHPLVKPNPLLKDDELPDPDKVRKNRQMFQQNNVKFARKEDRYIMLPISAKWLFGSSEKGKPRTTPEVRVVDTGLLPRRKKDHCESGGDSLMSGSSSGGSERPKRWTDTGSLSSGVSSDMSCFETDETGSGNVTGGFSSEEDEGPEGGCGGGQEPRHPVSPEVLNKIRACGTSVTYYGGRVIAHTTGPIRSPMTMTIMDEIRATGSAEERRRADYMGVKFRLVKSNSCGSRLELAGTDEGTPELSKIRFHEDVYGPAKNLGEELAECKGSRMEGRIDELPILPFNKAKTAFELKFGSGKANSVQSWRALIESRKQTRSAKDNRHCSDMEFEEFQVVEG